MAALIFPIAAGASKSAIIAASIGRLIVGVAASFVVQSVFGPDKPDQPGIKSKFAGQGDVSPQSIILGRTATAGHKVGPVYTMGNAGPDFGTVGTGKFATLIRNISDTPVHGLRKFFIDGVEFDYAADFIDHPTLGKQLRAKGELSEEKGDYSGKLFVQFYDGTQVQPSPYLRDAYGAHPTRPWTENSVHRGGAYAIVTLKFDRDLFTGNSPDILFEVDGLPLMDPRSGVVGPTENPVVMMWHLAQTITIYGDQEYGLGYDLEDLPQDMWFAAMNACDEAVTVDGVPEPLYRAGYEVRVAQPDQSGEEPLDVIDKLKQSCLGFVANVSGDLHVRVGAPGLPVALITDDDLLRDETETIKAIRGITEINNSIAATYPDASQKWAIIDAPTVTDEDAVADLGETRQAQLRLDAVPYFSQVQRMMAAYLKDAKRRLARGFFLPARWASIVLPLTTVALTSAVHGYENKLFEVQDHIEDPITGQIGVMLREVDPDDFSSDGINYQAPNASPPPIAVIPFELGEFTVRPAVVAGSDGVTVAVGFRVELEDVDDARDGFTVEYRIIGTEEIRSVSQPNGNLDYLNVFGEVLQNTTYEVRLRAIFEGLDLPTSWKRVTTENLPDVGSDTQRAKDLIAFLRDVNNDKEVKRVESDGVNARNVLDQVLSGRLDDADAEIIRVENLLSLELADAVASIAENRVLYTAADLALAGQVTTLQAGVAGNTASNQSTSLALANLTSSTANNFSVLEATVDDNTARQTSEELVRAAQDAVLSGRIDVTEASTANNSALIQTTQTALATAESARSIFEANATVDINGLLTVTSIQGGALSDVQGNQSAFIALRADGAELVLVSGNDPNGPKISGLHLGVDIVFVNGTLQSSNFSSANKTGWRLRLDGSFEFYGSLTRAAFANGELQFNYSNYSKRYATGTHNFAEDGVFVGVLIGGGGGGQKRPATFSVGGSAGGTSIIVIADAKKNEQFTVVNGSGGEPDDQTPTAGSASTFSCAAHGISATAFGGQGASGSDPGSGGSASGGYLNYTGGEGAYGFQTGGFGTPRFGGQAKNASGTVSGSPFIDAVRMDAFFLQHSTFDENSPSGQRWGCGARSISTSQSDPGNDGEDGTFIGGYLLAGDYT